MRPSVSWVGGDPTRRSFLVGGAALVGCAIAPAAAGEAPAAPVVPRPIPGVRPRADWGARPPRAGGRSHVPERFALHHTAGALVGSDRAPVTLRGIQAFHQRDKGWVDLAYHVFVDADGVAWEGRDPGIAGDTATMYDPAGWWLVCALGNFEEVAPTEAQIEGIARVLASIHLARGVPIASLAPHNALAATACPGRNLAVQLAGLVSRARALAQP
jgi:hypothetical protein